MSTTKELKKFLTIWIDFIKRKGESIHIPESTWYYELISMYSELELKLFKRYLPLSKKEWKCLKKYLKTDFPTIAELKGMNLKKFKKEKGVEEISIRNIKECQEIFRDTLPCNHCAGNPIFETIRAAIEDISRMKQSGVDFSSNREIFENISIKLLCNAKITDTTTERVKNSLSKICTEESQKFRKLAKVKDVLELGNVSEIETDGYIGKGTKEKIQKLQEILQEISKKI